MDAGRYGKLVRCKVPEIIKQEGGISITEIVFGQDLLQKLLSTLWEEIAELDRAIQQGAVEKAQEAVVNAQELFQALYHATSVSEAVIERARHEKLAEQGGFLYEKDGTVCGTFLIEVQKPEGGRDGVGN